MTQKITMSTEVVRQGQLLKLPRKGGLLNSSWKAHEFVLDVDKGTMSYYSKGKAKVAEAFKGESRLAGGMVAPAGRSVSGQKFVFELSGCVHEDGGEQALKMAAASKGEMDAWIIAIRATMKKHGAQSMRHVTALDDALTGRKKLGLDRDVKAQSQMDAIDEAERDRAESRLQEQMDPEDVHIKQDLTLDAVGRIKAQLNESNELAAATAETLHKQTEQIDAINDDLDKINNNVDRADKNFDTLERWRFFGGKSKKKAKKAEKEAREKLEKQSHSEEHQKGALHAVPHHQTHQEPPLSPSFKPGRHNVASGLEARDDDEQRHLDKIKQKDDVINDGLDDIDKLLENLGTAAKSLGEQTKLHNEKLKHMTGTTDEANVGVARINERAQYNVQYLK